MQGDKRGDHIKNYHNISIWNINVGTHCVCPFTDVMWTHVVCPYILLKLLTNPTACKRMIWNISLLKTKVKCYFWENCIFLFCEIGFKLAY
ncbi:hypothetical protein F9875_03520 [Glaesserella parasuis]|uniref:Uncharacterized protein n=1 Tax=Glaesserella parasuis TaxID=738 RepID=A0A859IGI0_GLAPU|nr:hypothetical protein [Glaesserella parasuis]MWP89215.1 hypothetical protein [Glaesserella parasuis]MWQ00198.1 hypothetical protein [Glaesserella parasuis]MWQ12269.1 hypothetical protein [Glaesserella parasuis]MWQ23131.1 hypothetical protein [Glaesserella parasuis]